MLKKTIKELSRHSFYYSLAWVAGSAASLLLLPVYTRFLSRAEYGILEILDYTNIILTIVVATGLNAAIPKFFNETENEEERKTIVSSATILSIIMGAVFSSIALGIDRALSTLILGTTEYKQLIDLNIILFYAQLVVYISGIGFIAAKQSKIYLTYMVIKLVVNISANLYFLVILEWGVLGMIYGNLLANTLVAVIITGHSIFINGVVIRLSVIKKLIKFGLPLIPASLLATIMHNADRFLIRYYGSLNDVGIYSLGYKFPFMLNAAIMQSFNFIWAGATMYEIAKKPDSSYQYGRIATYVIGFFIFAQLGLSIFSKSIMRLLVDQKFFPAHQVIPFVALGLCFHAFYFFFSMGSFIKKKTWLVNLAFFPAAIINVAGNMLLLPYYGYMAAAWISLLTYLVFSLILYAACRKLIEVKYEFKRLAVLFTTSVMIYLLSLLFTMESFILETGKGIILLLGYAGLLYKLGWFTENEKDTIRIKMVEIKSLLTGTIRV